MRKINEIIVHCTATRPSWYENRAIDDVVSELTRWHVEDNKWSDCGYHVVVDRRGNVGSARPVERSGAHCRGKNSNSIGVTILGGRGGCADDKFLDNYTPEQDAALRKVIKDLKRKHRGIKKVSGHNSYSSKACPCFDVKSWLSG